MAFITKSNARHLEFQTDKESVKKIYFEDLYKLSLWMLTKKEQQWLAAARMFYENPEFYINNIYKEVKREVNSNLVYVPGAPAYHEDRKCKVLNSRYVNYVIPPEIADRGETEVAKFREWWKSEEILLAVDAKRFLEKMSIRWLLKNPPKLESIKADNSGVEIQENNDLHKVEADIKMLIDKMTEIRKSNKALIDKLGKRTFAIKNNSLSIDVESEENILSEWHQMKENLKDNLRIYFRLRFNPDLKVKDTILESLGFRPCAQCHENN